MRPETVSLVITDEWGPGAKGFEDREWAELDGQVYLVMCEEVRNPEVRWVLLRHKYGGLRWVVKDETRSVS